MASSYSSSSSSSSSSVFAHTFLVTTGDKPTLHIVAPDEAAARKKRPHRKSRLGCIRCKRRKVKCDETDPCGNCVKRGEKCVRSLLLPPQQQRSPTSHSKEGNESSSSDANNIRLGRQMDAWSTATLPLDGFGTGGGGGGGEEGVNMLHMELLHHFERDTMRTLIFKDLWPGMLQLAFRSQQHTFLITAMLSLSAAHLSSLNPSQPRYHAAKHALLDRALSSYRTALSEPITSSNCDALLGGAVLVHYLLWTDLSFLDSCSSSGEFNLSGDRLYHLSTGQRQIFFMAWPLFQSEGSAFRHAPVIAPCMTIAYEVEARGLHSWKRFLRGFMGVYDNPRYHGCLASSLASPPAFGYSDLGLDLRVGEEQEEENRCPSVLRSTTLWDSYKAGEAFVASGGVSSPESTRAAYARLAERVAMAFAWLLDTTERQEKTDGEKEYWEREHASRYVLTFAMLCFGPLLPVIARGESRVLVLLWHVYRAAGELLPGEGFWWGRRRVEVMKRVIGEELGRRGVRVCLRDVVVGGLV
ncbi:sterol uptake control protein 2 [Echria macrotheca]|uniref:Sterol uptake control protein 2 n=1 Tax=Echria macrotheca TaxID=438768 RepID=A0AAJ0B667_9PEZI|nr:sterol uptake control protein 2 [Echria macrotheca]